MSYPVKAFLLGLIVLVSVVGCSAGASSPSVVPDSLGSSPSPDPSSIAQPTSSAGGPASVLPTEAPVATGQGHRPAFPPGMLLTTVTDRLRVRSLPSTADDSVRYEPVLPIGTMLHALEGPVAGSSYWWYRVELGDGQTLFDGVREGWVAAAAQDGAPWIDVYADVDPGPTFPPVRSGWPSVRAGDVALLGGTIEPGDTGGLDVRVEIRGRLPGSVEFVTAGGDSRIEWYCGGGPEGGEIGGGILDLGAVTGRAEVTTEITVGSDGVGRATILLPVDEATEPCPEDYPGPKFATAGRWSDVHVTAPAYGIRLTPPDYEWADTF